MNRKPVVVAMVDDDSDDFEIVKDLLNRQAYNRYQAVWIKNFEEGLERLKRNDGDVFLIDYNLGAKNGLDLLAEAKLRGLRKPVIFLTGSNDAEIDLRAMEMGAAHFIQKSQLTVDHLLERSIRYAIRSAEASEELRSFERLKIEKNAAESASRMKNLFLANVSHEIRTPLGAILGFTELALKDPPPEDRTKFLKVIQRNAEHLLALVNDLLDLSKMEAGKFEVELNPCDWRAIVNDVVATMQPSAVAKDNRIVFKDAVSHPKMLITDGHFLRQILINLIGNAIKFTRGGNIEVIVEEGKFFALSVRDSGIGMSPEQRNRLFEPFTQGESGLHRHFGGTGLGLHLSRRMANALNGNLVLASSAIGLGSTFLLNLPAVWDHGTESAAAQERDEHIQLKGFRILVADDSEDNQLLLEHLLREAGAHVSVVANGQEAVIAAQNQPFNVIVMDIQMPEMDGFEAAARIKSLGLATPIVALSAHAMPEERQRAMSSGFSEYLTKPIRTGQLLACLSKFA